MILGMKPTRFYFTFITLIIGIGLILAVLLRIETVQNFLSRATGRPANLVIDANSSAVSRTKPWHNLAQGGESFDHTFTPITSQITALDPDYIRIDHIYDFYDIVSRDASGQLQFDFTRLNARIREITATGALPFISLSYMPPALSSGDVVAPPRNWSEWSLLVERTIENISGRDQLNLSDVYYEVWNEPDLFGGWKLYGERNYLTLYHQTAIGARNATNVNPFKLGGPATTSFYTNWYTQFLAYVRQHQLKLDFYSWHAYSPDLDTYDSHIRQYLTLSNDLSATHLEPIITEWGITPEVHPWHDQKISAIHLLAASAVHVPVVSKAFIFEIQDGLDPQGQAFWGRWGLLTHQNFNNQPKPRYQAIQTLNQLEGNLLSVGGQGTWVKALASRSPDNRTLHVLVINYDLSGRHTEVAPITFTNLDQGNYQLTETYEGRTPITRDLTIQNSSLVHQVHLPPNTYAFLTLTEI